MYLFNIEHFASMKHLAHNRIPFAAVALHQGFATVAPPTTAPTTAAPHKEPSRPERGNYVVKGSNGTACLLASMGLQLNVTFSSLSQNKVLKYTHLRLNISLATFAGFKC